MLPRIYTTVGWSFHYLLIVVLLAAATGPASLGTLDPLGQGAAVNVDTFKQQLASLFLTLRSTFVNGNAALSDWVNGTDPCTWTGIECGSGTGGVGMDLSGRGLQGTIVPETWTKLKPLTSVSLARNNLTGTLPSKWLPSELVSLDMSNNSLGGTLPSDFSIPSSLTSLLLSNNTFHGTIPAWSLPGNLNEFALNGNGFTGPLPVYLVLPVGLQTLLLSSNRLTGTLDPSWDFPPALATLDLSNNLLEGSLPSKWTLPPFLEVLHLHSNPFLSGPLPQGWVVPDTLAEIQTQHCNISGPIPKDLNVQKLLLSNNMLTGTIPADWVPPSRLALDYNMLQGTISRAWSLAGVLELRLSNNNLAGTLPPDLELSTGLATLTLASNALTGTVPKSWTLPDTLQTLHLNNNQLRGSLDPGWKLPNSLLDFRVDGNHLTGLLPAWNLSNLDVALYTGCNFSGPLPSYPAPESAVVVVEPQSGSGFCGEIPSSPPYYYDSSDDPSSPQYERMNSTALAACPEGTPVRYSYPPPSPPPRSRSPSPTIVRSPSPSVPSSPPFTAVPEGPPTSSGIAIGVGVAAGLAALLAIATAAFWWRKRAVKARQGRQIYKGLGVDAKEGSSWAQSPGKGDLGLDPSEPSEPKLVAEKVHCSSDRGGLTAGRTRKALATQGDPELPESWEPDTPDGSAEEAWQRQQQLNRQKLDMSGLRNWVIDFSTLELKQPIGKGSFGTVYYGKWQHTTVAVKVMVDSLLDVLSQGPELTLSSPEVVNLQKEAALMCRLRHPNIVTFLGVCPLPPCVVTEYCERGSLGDVLHKAKQSPPLAARLHWVRRLNMLLETAKGMLYLHSHKPPVIHRDLKSHNLLVDSDWHCKVSDFNLSRILEDRVGLSSGNSVLRGPTNPRWLAPEVLEGHPADLKSDVYSFGIVLWELLTWDIPYQGYEHFQLIKHVVAGGRPTLPPWQELPGCQAAKPGGLGDYIQLLSQCWAQMPEDRPSFQAIADSIRDILVEAKAGSIPW